MIKKKKLPKARGPGAPKKESSEKKMPRGLTEQQWAWFKNEAAVRNLPAAAILREAADWYITAKETKRGDVVASEMFDDKLATISE